MITIIREQGQISSHPKDLENPFWAQKYFSSSFLWCGKLKEREERKEGRGGEKMLFFKARWYSLTKYAFYD